MRIKCKLPHPTPSKKTVSGIQDGVDAAGARRISKEDEEDFVKNYIQRPVFGGNNESDEINDLLLLENELNRSEDEDGDELGEDGEGDLEDDLSGDEAEELLKWYDDNLGNDKNADPNTA
ncbi:hypothetical protein LPJ75_006859 [Coemansia sp. RSA 2598]|nr:hypothetical protein LPJ75_006859 [Coemansia sp. RSA 2598]